MLISPLALAQSSQATRASTVLTAAKASAPVAGARASTRLAKKSDLTQTVVVAIIVGGIIVGYAFYEVVIDDSESP